VSFVPVSPAHMHGMGWAPQLSPMHGGPHYASLPRSPSYQYFAALPGQHGSPPAPPPPANGGTAGMRHAASSSRLSDHQRPPTARHSRTSSWASNGGAHSSGAGYEAEIAAARRRHGSRPSAATHQVHTARCLRVRNFVVNAQLPICWSGVWAPPGCETPVAASRIGAELAYALPRGFGRPSCRPRFKRLVSASTN